MALNYRHLDYFRAVAHDGNLTRTAARLNVSQSALSSQIRTLEARLGHPLFERRARALHLTEAGRIALDHADAIFATGDELIGTLRETGHVRARLRVGALATLSRNFQIAFLRPVLDDAGVDVVLRSGSMAELVHGLDALNLDLLLVNRPPAGDNRHVRRLVEQRVSLVGTPARIAGDHDLAALLACHPVIVPGSGSGVRDGFDALVGRLGIRPRIAAQVDDMAMLRLLARADVGLAVLPPIVVRDELAAGSLVEIDPLPGVVESFYAVTRPRRFANPVLARLLDDHVVALE